LTTFTGYAVHARSLESHVVLHGPKETGNLPWEGHRLDNVPGHLADLSSHADKGKKGGQMQVSVGVCGLKFHRICRSQ